ncbi:MAG TPA: EVE domain-containing protein [Gemmatimonadaceae bacterium]|nr:EVE domain-containing protein [Gemmatimonadaceae bacterium]
MAAKKTTTRTRKTGAAAAAKKRVPARAPRAPEDEMDTAERSASPKSGKWAWVFKREPGEVRYWLVKTEPEVFSFDDLLRRHGRTTCWDGVRNYAARNFLRDGMKLGDRVFFYHSSTEPPMIVGECEVAREGYVDHTAFDAKHRHYDPASKQDDPQWYMVDLRAVAQFTKPVTLEQIKLKQSLKDMALVRIGRLSVSPVTEKEYKVIRAMAG